MPPDEHLHLDRSRAESFGAVAAEYDSRYLVLDPDTRNRARTDLAALVGPGGVRIENDALLVLARKPA